MFKEIEAKEYFDLYKKYKSVLCVSSSYTDVDGNNHLWSTGNPQWMTEWSLKDTDIPLIKAESETIDDVTIHKYYKYY
jgi:hypothetical protein